MKFSRKALVPVGKNLTILIVFHNAMEIRRAICELPTICFHRRKQLDISSAMNVVCVLVLNMDLDQIRIVSLVMLFNGECPGLVAHWIHIMIYLHESNAGTAIGHSFLHSEIRGVDHLELCIHHREEHPEE